MALKIISSMCTACSAWLGGIPGGNDQRDGFAGGGGGVGSLTLFRFPRAQAQGREGKSDAQRRTGEEA